jgi:hypothetical protein
MQLRSPLLAAVLLLLAACGTAPPAASSGPTPAPGLTAAPTGPATPPAALRLTATDVTMIWPLPTDPAQLDSMLAATSTGGHGELLPANLYAVPVLDERDVAATDPKADRARLRVVAARFEPCRGSFGSPHEASCVNQIRLVFQVLRPAGGGVTRDTIGANDGAVLAFYKLTRDEVLALAREIVALRGEDGGSDTLGVHPRLARDGLGSAYAKQLQGKLLALVGAKRLTKLTFFSRTRAKEPQWPFGTFTVVDGAAVKKPIPTLTVDHQTLEGSGPRNVIEPLTSSPDNPAALLALMGPARTATPAERDAYAAVLRIQHPGKHNPDTMACAECHAAQRMQAAAERTLGLRAADFASDAYASKVQAAPGKIHSENFHLAGYLGTNLAVATRTVHDTNAVLDAMHVLLAE